MKYGWFGEGEYRYVDTGEIFRGKPASIQLGDPNKYWAPDGRRIVPPDDWGNTGVPLKDSLSLDLEDVKKYLRVEFDHDNRLIENLIASALEFVDHELNRRWEPGKVPAPIKIAVLQIIAWWYENRGDQDGMPSFAEDVISRYRFIPGT